MLLPEKIHKTRKYLYYAFIVLLLAIGAGSSIFVYFEVNKSSRQHIVDRANTIAATVSQEQIAGLAGDASDIGTSQYENIKDVLVSIRSVNHDIRFVYIIGNRDNNLFFYVDSENPQSEDYSPPGQPYEEASQQMKDLFVVGIPSVEGPSADRWGVWISAYAPILDKSGHVVALLGVDTPARDYIINVITYASLPTLAAIFLVVVISIIQRMRAKELQYVDQKAEFLSIASHEIRTPLTGMRWTMENLMNRNDAAFDAQTKKLLAMMYESCMGLISRMNNLLSIASMEEGGKLPILKIEKVKIRGVIGDVVNSLALTARQRNIMISIGNSIRDELVVELLRADRGRPARQPLRPRSPLRLRPRPGSGTAPCGRRPAPDGPA